MMSTHDNLPETLVKWLRHEVCYSPRGEYALEDILTARDFEQLAQGETAKKILQFLIDNVRSYDRIIQLKDNVKVHKYRTELFGTAKGQHGNNFPENSVKTEEVRLDSEITSLLQDIEITGNRRAVALSELRLLQLHRDKLQDLHALENEHLSSLREAYENLHADVLDLEDSSMRKIEHLTELPLQIESCLKGLEDESPRNHSNEEILAYTGEKLLSVLSLRLQNQKLQEYVEKHITDKNANILRHIAVNAAKEKAEDFLLLLNSSEHEKPTMPSNDNTAGYKSLLKERSELIEEIENIAAFITYKVEALQENYRKVKEDDIHILNKLEFVHDAILRISELQFEEIVRKVQSNQKIKSRQLNNEKKLADEHTRGRLKQHDNVHEASISIQNLSGLFERTETLLNSKTPVELKRILNLCTATMQSTVCATREQITQTQQAVTICRDEPGFHLPAK